MKGLEHIDKLIDEYESALEQYLLDEAGTFAERANRLYAADIALIQNKIDQSPARIRRMFAVHERVRTLKQARLPMDFDAAYDEIASAMEAANKHDGHVAADRAAARCGLLEKGDGTPSQITVYERTEGDRTLRFKSRWYDQSKAFSIQPDMNVLNLELLSGDKIVRQKEYRYEDAY
jgi:hypothetical protein